MKHTPIPEKMLTSEEVIEIMGLNTLRHPRRVLARLTKAGKLPAIRITRNITRYRESDVAELQRALAEMPCGS